MKTYLATAWIILTSDVFQKQQPAFNLDASLASVLKFRRRQDSGAAQCLTTALQLIVHYWQTVHLSCAFNIF